MDQLMKEIKLGSNLIFLNLLNKLSNELSNDELTKLCIDNLPHAAWRFQEAKKKWSQYIDECEEEFKKSTSQKDKEAYELFKEWKKDCEFNLDFEEYLEKVLDIKVVDEPGVHFVK